ncbi:MAG: aminotransferase class III-fold pyridoxal phosphate-dependent enzyme [Candidatus Riflebacteria bacterium]|nr:aminotransferase class III-fold pyridoxal phosphate-dependent enzyme [Candidatus Riflebacteria bacterium]
MKNLLKCHEIIKNDFERSEGCYLFDSQGRRHIDFESGIWCTSLGHIHPRINHVIQKQISKIIHLGTRYPSLLAEEAAQEVLSIVGVLEGKCLFLSSGSEAVEFGAQAIREFTKKTIVIVFF